MTSLTAILIIIGVVVLVLGLLFWVTVGLSLFLGAATMADLHDNYPLDEDFEEHDRKKK